VARNNKDNRKRKKKNATDGPRHQIMAWSSEDKGGGRGAGLVGGGGKRMASREILRSAGMIYIIEIGSKERTP